jgi:hypothetical protein
LRPYLEKPSQKRAGGVAQGEGPEFKLQYGEKKINSKWITDLNGRPKTLKLFEEDIGEMLQDLGTGNDFLRFQ